MILIRAYSDRTYKQVWIFEEAVAENDDADSMETFLKFHHKK